MKIKIDGIKYYSANVLEITLDNGNTIQIHESDSGSIELKNTTEETSFGNSKSSDELGLGIYPISYSTVEITPEG